MRDFSKGNLEYAKVHRFLSLLSKNREYGDIKLIIKNSSLSRDAKSYFIDLLDGIAENQYGDKGGNNRDATILPILRKFFGYCLKNHENYW